LRQKEIEEKMKEQVINEIEKHQMNEAINDMFVKNKFDVNLLEEKVK